MAAFLNRKIDIETWLVFSTAISVFLIIKMFSAGIDIYVGYPVVIFNTLLLLLLGRLMIHRIQAIIIGVVTLGSLVAAHFSSTLVTSIIAQIVGILVFSTCYFSVLATSGPTVPRWMEIYASFAFLVAVYGIFENIIFHHIMQGDPYGEQRLKSIFAEPSLFIYTTLPAIGYYINLWVTERRYGLESLIFLLAYVLADAALGFFGLLLIGILVFIKRLTVWHVLGGLIVSAALLAALFFVSENFRIRATDTAVAVSSQSVANVNGSTFAFLTNLYVAGKALADHPVLGIGIGGYRSTYDFYIQDFGEEDLKGNTQTVGLNKDDANSLFLRVAAELGPAGLIALLSFLIVCAQVKGKPHRQIRNALLPYFLVRMSRFGAYFSMELYFFVGLYLFNYLDYRRTVAPPEPLHLAPGTALRAV